MKRVVVTGMGAITPLGLDVDTFWNNIIAGKNGISQITKFDTTDYKTKIAAEIKDFNSEKYFDRMEVRKLDLYAQYAIAAAVEAVGQSGIISKVKPERLGVYVGSGIGGIVTLLSNAEVLAQRGPSRVSAALIPMMIANIGAAHIAIKFNAKGPCLPVVTACATGAHSIGEAFLAIRNGMADAIIAGGAEASICGLGMAGFINCMAVTTTTDVNAASLPFDKRRSGFVMGEGSGILILEEYEHAKSRGAKILAEVVGYANTCDAYHVTAPSPDADGCIRMLRDAVKMANIKEGEKIYINPHGTGTDLNDKTETLMIKTVFGERAKSIPCSSTKSMTGHLLGAAGAVESIVAIQSLIKGVVPPTINLNEPDPECDLDYVPHVMREYNSDVAISVNLGFGGHNAGLVFRKVKN